MAKFSAPDVPQGYSKGSFFRKMVWEFLFGGKFPLKGKRNVTVEWDSSSRTYFISAEARASSSASIDVVLYDPAKACSAGTFYKVRSTDAAAVSGVDYTVNGVAAKTKATPGKYLCLQSTAPNTSDSFTAAQVPQLPDPISTDPKADGKYWEWFSPSTVCTANGAVEV